MEATHINKFIKYLEGLVFFFFFPVFPCYTQMEIFLRQRVKDNFWFQKLFLLS